MDVQRRTRLTPAEFDEVIAMLVTTYDNHPHVVAVFPDAICRAKATRALFAASLNDGLRAGIVDIVLDEKIVGVSIVYPPGTYPPPLWRVLRALPEWLQIAAISPRGLLSLIQTKKVLDALRPKEPHYYGFCIGIDPSRQGSGIGNVLQDRMFDDAARDGSAIYVETQKRSLFEWLLSRGFTELHKQVEMFPGGPLTWSLWRSAQGKALQSRCRV